MYQLNDLSESCFESCSANNSELLQLGVPFLFSEMGLASAFSGNDPEDAGYRVYVNLTVRDSSGDSLPITEVALPTPEPAVSG